MLSPRIRPIGLETPTAAVLTQLMQCLAEGSCQPRTIWVGCPWYCALPLASWLRGWRTRCLLGLPAETLIPRVPAGSARVVDSQSVGPASEPPPQRPRRLDDLHIEWPSDRKVEIVRVYDTRPQPVITVIVPGAIFDLMI